MSKIEKPRYFSRPSDPMDNKYRGRDFLWAVYPDYWKPQWGDKPLLGHVRADTEFDARYAAYDKGLLPYNYTFAPEVIRVNPKNNRSTK